MNVSWSDLPKEISHNVFGYLAPQLHPVSRVCRNWYANIEDFYKEVLHKELNYVGSLVEARDYQKLKKYIKIFPHTQRNAYRQIPLHIAAGKGDLECAKVLLEQEGELGLRWQSQYLDENSDTPLHAAVRGGIKSVVTLLLAHKAVPDSANKLGHTPLHLAVLLGKISICQELVEKGSDPFIKNAKGKSPFQLALEGQNKHITSIFSKKIPLSPSNKKGRIVVPLTVNRAPRVKSSKIIPQESPNEYIEIPKEATHIESRGEDFKKLMSRLFTICGQYGLDIEAIFLGDPLCYTWDEQELPNSVKEKFPIADFQFTLDIMQALIWFTTNLKELEKKNYKPLPELRSALYNFEQEMLKYGFHPGIYDYTIMVLVRNLRGELGFSDKNPLRYKTMRAVPLTITKEMEEGRSTEGLLKDLKELKYKMIPHMEDAFSTHPEQEPYSFIYSQASNLDAFPALIEQLDTYFPTQYKMDTIKILTQFLTVKKVEILKLANPVEVLIRILQKYECQDWQDQVIRVLIKQVQKSLSVRLEEYDTNKS